MKPALIYDEIKRLAKDTKYHKFGKPSAYLISREVGVTTSVVMYVLTGKKETAVNAIENFTDSKKKKD